MDDSGRAWITCKCGAVQPFGHVIQCSTCGASLFESEDEKAAALDELQAKAETLGRSEREDRRADRERAIRGNRFIGGA